MAPETQRDSGPGRLSVAQQAWDAAWPEDVQSLFDQVARHNLEATPFWYRHLAATAYVGDTGISLWVLRRAGHAVAALPVRIERLGSGQALSALTHPHFSALFSPALAPDLTSDELSVLVRSIVCAHKGLSRLSFSPLDIDAPAFACLRQALQSAGLRCFKFFCFNNWHLLAPPSWQAYLAARSANQRSSIKRGARKLAAHGGRVEIISQPADVDRALNAYWRIYAASWKQDEPLPAFIDGLVRGLADRGELRLGLAWLEARPIAAQIWRVGRDRADICKLAYDEDFKALAPGNALSAALLQHVIEVDRVQRVDYLMGNDAYKRTWMSDHCERWGLVAFNPATPAGLLGALKQGLSEHSRQWRSRWRAWRLPDKKGDAA